MQHSPANKGGAGLTALLVIVSLICATFVFTSCGSNRKTKYTPIKSRRLPARPGEGAKLDNEIATLLKEGKRIAALKRCTEILFSTRSPRDRETAQFWKAVIGALEQIDEKNYEKAAETITDASKWMKSSSRVYYLSLVVDFLNQLDKHLEENNRIRIQSNMKKKEKRQIEALNQQLLDKVKELKTENAKLEKLLEILEAQTLQQRKTE